MATTFRATDLRSTQTVAIKVPHLEMECDPVFFERFQREAEIGREMSHAGVMKVMPDESTDRVYMVMEMAVVMRMARSCGNARSCEGFPAATGGPAGPHQADRLRHCGQNRGEGGSRSASFRS
jgi:hypothetical protein